MKTEHRGSEPLVKFNRRKEAGTLKGPLRVIRLCLLSIILPGVLIAGPLYLRYRVYSEQAYPLGMSDMRMMDGRISTTWCQRQLVKSNATYNAYLLAEQPQVELKPAQVSMVKHLNLGDDMKEYWGFYLLKGSTVTVSTCCRWPGASLIIISGHRHLKECAYIGDNSSEELDELEEIKNEKKKSEAGDLTADGASNEPDKMKRIRPGVVFHGSQQDENWSKYKISKEIPDNENDHDPVQFKLQKAKKGDEKNTIKADNRKMKNVGKVDAENIVKSKESEKGKQNDTAIVEDIKLDKESSHEFYLNPPVPENETKKENNTEDMYRSFLSKLLGLGDRGKDMVRRLSEHIAKNRSLESSSEHRKRREIILTSLHDELTQHDEKGNAAEEEDVQPKEDIRGTINGTTLNDRSNSEFWSSFSSSEERLIQCAGLVLNLPLTPKINCDPAKPEETQAEAGHANKLTYLIPRDGYYFFLFSSENEVQPNYLRIHFHLEKKLYNVSNPVAACTNTTDSCSLPLNFFSKEKVVLELPVNSNDSSWNHEYVVVSTCEPRTLVYAACVIAVPILILLFAF